MITIITSIAITVITNTVFVIMVFASACIIAIMIDNCIIHCGVLFPTSLHLLIATSWKKYEH